MEKLKQAVEEVKKEGLLPSSGANHITYISS